MSEWIDATVAVPEPDVFVLCYTNSDKTEDWHEPYFMGHYYAECRCWFKIRTDDRHYLDWHNQTEVAFWLPLNRLPSLPPISQTPKE